jgi:isoquinoline 1-oxidoreductase beta subunit
MLAEELDADWSKVKTEFAPANPKVYGNPHDLFHGAQITAASVSVPGYFMPLRMAGAQARKVLLDAAAEKWKVPVAELTTDKSTIVHKKSGRKITYGEVVAFATVPAEPPKISEADLKKPAQFKLIGRKDIGRSDVPSKVNGSAKYGIDVQVPGMVYASVLQAPMEGAKAKDVNGADVMKMKGVAKVIPLPFGVAVIGDSVEATRAGVQALKVTWDTSGATAAGFDSDKAKDDYAAKAKDPNAETKVEYQVGDVKAGLTGAAKTVEAGYWSEYTYHAQMEPRLRSAPLAGRSDPGDDSLQHHEETSEADPHARGRHCRRASAADDPSSDEGRHRRPRQCRRLAPSSGVGKRRCSRSATALQGHRRQGLHRRTRPRSGLLRHSERTR